MSAELIDVSDAKLVALPNDPAPTQTPKPRPPSTLFPALIAFLGSTGLISVFGPITGELFWDGYLSAFGLTSLEFPASDNEVRVHAYVAMAIAVTNFWMESWKAVLLLAGSMLMVAALAHVGTAPLPMRWKAAFLGNLRSAATSNGKRRIAVRAGSWLLVTAALSTFAMVLVTSATLVFVGPFFARQAGSAEGLADLKKMREAQAKGNQCMAVRADGLAFKCPRVVVYGKEQMAVLDSERIYRVSRASAMVTSPIPEPTPAKR